jgi:predicted acyl esterase
MSYQAHHVNSNLTFQYVFPVQTEITGHSSVKLWIQAMSYPDADLYLALQKLDTSGKEVKFYHSTQQIEAPATLGWLRVSHRELDPERSIPGRPYHKHAKRQWLRPRDIVPVDVELWPQSTIWEKGETMRLSIQGRSFTDPENPTQAKSPVHGFGEIKVWYGGEYDSALLVPIVEC